MYRSNKNDLSLNCFATYTTGEIMTQVLAQETKQEYTAI